MLQIVVRGTHHWKHRTFSGSIETTFGPPPLLDSTDSVVRVIFSLTVRMVLGRQREAFRVSIAAVPCTLPVEVGAHLGVSEEGRRYGGMCMYCQAMGSLFGP